MEFWVNEKSHGFTRSNLIAKLIFDSLLDLTFVSLNWFSWLVNLFLFNPFVQESILAISFSNKVSRYICTGGSGQVVRIWDLQRKRCIKWLRGHTNTITGAMYNCKDEYLASISLSGDLILHNLASGARTAELKDPNEQVGHNLSCWSSKGQVRKYIFC